MIEREYNRDLCRNKPGKDFDANLIDEYLWIRGQDLFNMNLYTPIVQSCDSGVHQRTRYYIHKSLQKFNEFDFDSNLFDRYMNDLLMGDFGSIRNYRVISSNESVVYHGKEIILISIKLINDEYTFNIIDLIESKQSDDYKSLGFNSNFMRIGVLLGNRINMCHLLYSTFN